MRFKLSAILAFLLLAAPVSAQFLGPPQNITVIDSGTACVTAPAACASFTSGTAVSIGIDISGTWTGTLTFEQTTNGFTWRTLWVTNAATGVQVSSTTAGGSWTVANTFIGVRVRATNTVTGLAVVTATRGWGVATHLFDASVITGTLAANHGGTGFASYAVGDLLYADTTTTLAKRAAVASGQVLASAGTSTAPAYTATPTVTSATASQANLITTPTDGIVLSNSTNATSGVPVQMPPRIKMLGSAWNSSGGGTLEADYFTMEVLPVTVAGTTTATWKLGTSINGAGVTYPLTVVNGGNVTALNALIATNAGLSVAASASVVWNSQERLFSPADGKLKIVQNSNATVGVEINTGTAAPTVANCSVGSTGTVTAHSSNSGGQINPGSGSTSCDVVFGAPNWSFAPFCTISDNTSVILAPTVSALSVTGFTVTGLTAGDKFTYVCVGGAI